MVGKDSPLLIDCPPAKHAGLSSAHASLEAAVAKFRMTAYMWQALTAEDMRRKGLGRRSFRLDEDWAADTTSAAFANAAHDLFAAGAMRATAKVHLVRSERTVAEIRDEHAAQQNGRGRRRGSLHACFTDALQAYAADHPALAASARPVVAGLILDAHYSPSQGLILGHAALGAHNPTGLSLGVMGSHLAYAWPRFLEEVTAALLDTRAPGATVGNDNGECGTLWEACAIGQGAFLHEVGHAFGAPHTGGLMARGYAVHWPRHFVARTAWCARDHADGVVVVDDEAAAADNEARWALKDALGFSCQPHFWLPSDHRPALGAAAPTAAPAVTVGVDETAPGRAALQIAATAGLARIRWNGETDASLCIAEPVRTLRLTDLEARFSREAPLRLHVLGMNGKDRTVANVWRFFGHESFVRIPGASFVLHKRSVMAKDLEEGGQGMDDKQFWEWTTLLHKRKGDGALSRAVQVDVRTGCVLDGAYVHYDDGSRENCGPVFAKHTDGGHKQKHTFGGHASQAISIPAGQDIAKIEVARSTTVLAGMTFHLGDGTRGGKLSGGGTRGETLTLEVADGERIVGFYGRSYWGEYFDALVEFGILTAPILAELPDAAYSMAELQNVDGGVDESQYEDWDDGHEEDVEEDTEDDDY